MNHDRRYFGCGTLTTEEGGRVLLALRSGLSKPTEILDLTKEGSEWKTLPASMEAPKEDYGSSYSFITSKDDETTGFFLPYYENYIYRVKCTNSKKCSFTKITTGHRNPHYALSMSVPRNSGLTCP